MMELITDPQVWILLVTLSAIEIVLGIDNLVFISIAVSKLPLEQREFARKFGIAVACITRIGLLLTLAWLAGLTDPLFEAFGRGISVRDLILILGGLFLIVKGAMEIREQLKGDDDEAHGTAGKVTASFGAVIAQIAVIDIVFSLDSVITAVGMADQLWVMVLAVMIAMAIMVAASTPLANFVSTHPTVKMLALSFLLLIGVLLTADGFGHHVNRGYVYFAMAFSLIVELMNMRFRRKTRRTTRIT